MPHVSPPSRDMGHTTDRKLLVPERGGLQSHFRHLARPHRTGVARQHHLPNVIDRGVRLAGSRAIPEQNSSAGFIDGVIQRTGIVAARTGRFRALAVEMNPRSRAVVYGVGGCRVVIAAQVDAIDQEDTAARLVVTLFDVTVL